MYIYTHIYIHIRSHLFGELLQNACRIRDKLDMCDNLQICVSIRFVLEKRYFLDVQGIQENGTFRKTQNSRFSRIF